MFFQKVSLWTLVVSILILAGCAGKNTTVKTPGAVKAQSVTIEQKDCGQEIEVRDQQICYQAKLEAANKKINELRRAQKTPEEKKIEKKIESQREKEERARINAAVHCPNRDDVSKVSIDPEVTGQWSFQQYAKIVIINPGNWNADTITDTFLGRPVVRNLCPGGQITLFKSLNWVKDANQIQWQYIATGTFPDGTTGTAQSPGMYLNAYQGAYTNGGNQTWIIQFQKWIPQR